MSYSLRFGLLIGLALAPGGMIAPADARTGPTLAQAEEPVITDPVQLWAMPAEQKREVHRLRLEGRVSYYDTGYKLCWIEENHVGTYVQIGDPAPDLETGQMVRIEGTIVPSEGLTATRTTVTILRDYAPIDPLPAAGRINDLDALQGRVVTVDAYVVNQQKYDAQHVHLNLIVDNRPVIGWIRPDDPQHIPDWGGRFVRVQALYSARFDPTRTNLTVELWMSRQSDLQVLEAIAELPTLPGPATPIGEIHRLAAGSPAKIVGEVAAQEIGTQIVVRDSTGEVVVHSYQWLPVPLGTTVEVVGRVAPSGSGWILDGALYRPMPSPAAATASEAPVVLRSVAQIRELSAAEAAQGRPAKVTGLVIMVQPEQHCFYLLDISGGIRVRYDPALFAAPPLDKYFEIAGPTYQDRFTPAVELRHLTDLGSMSPPAPHRITYDQAISGKEDGQWVTIRGFLHHTVLEQAYQSISITAPEGEFVASLSIAAPFKANHGALLQVRGVCETNTRPDGRIRGFTIWVPTSADIVVTEDAPVDYFNLPLLTLADIRQLSAAPEMRRVRVAGRVLDAVPGEAVYLAEGGLAQLLLTSETAPLTPGDRIEAVGILGREGARTILRGAVYRRTASGPPPEPLELAAGDPLSAAHDLQLVRMRGVLLDRIDEPRRTRLILQSGGTIFEARLSRDRGFRLRGYEVGAGLELTGLYRLEYDDARQLRGFHLRLRSPADMVIFQPARFWTVEHALMACGILAGCMLLGVGWIAALRRRVNRQTDQIRTQIGHQARLEVEVHRAARLESLGTLAGGIAHDFNNLLTVVLGNASLALTEPDKAAVAGHLREIERGARRARELTQQLLTFAKGGAPLRSSVSLAEVVRNAADLVLGGTAIRSEYDLAPDLWSAHVDREQIAQAIENLALNAVQAMPQGGTLRISLHNERITEGDQPGLATGRYLKLVVADTGPGIDPAALPKIFDPYFSIRKDSGGLGLATVYSIVRRHLGHIEVESKPGQGTVFRLWLPASVDSTPPIFPSRAAPPQPEAAAAPNRKPRVLVMDDEESIRRVLEIFLRRIGAEPVLAEDGAAAIRTFADERAGGRPIDLLILDLTVPGGMGGRQVIEKIRRTDKETPAIVASGYSNDPVLSNFKDHGFQAMVQKPFDIRALSEVIGRFVVVDNSGHRPA